MTSFSRLTFDDFRSRAKDHSLTPNERIGFPEGYRAGKEQAILIDIVGKLPPLSRHGSLVVDIGCGCGDLARLLIAHCDDWEQHLVLVDSQEMLDALPVPARGQHSAHRFPGERHFLDAFGGRADCVIVYSVIHHEFLSGNLWAFMDAVASLLAPGGMALIGDIPNRSMRRRFFRSEGGRAFHRSFTGGEGDPPVPPEDVAPGEIDDSVVMALLMRARGQGLHAYLVPQAADLPFANRREDVILHRP